MNKLEAKNLIFKTFENPFNEAQFIFFIKNLLNDLDESKSKDYRGNLIPDAFSDAVSIYKRIGQYKDPKNNVIDILTVKLKKETSLERARSLQRNFIARYLKQHTHEAALVAYFTEGSNDWRFSFVKMDINLKDKKIETDFTPARRYSFLVGTNEGSHTAQNQFVKLLTENEENPILQNIENAFNIETVTKEFFLRYRDLFIRIKQALDFVVKSDPNIISDFETKEINSVSFSKKLLGQIVFLYFLQKKGWFGVDKNSAWGSGSKKFLRELFEKKHCTYNNFFNDILEPLFYEALRNDRSHEDHYYSRFDCKIPFLNGGLFDPIGNYDWVKTDIVLPNELFSNTNPTKEGDIGDGILDVFDRYNFTVIEDEPLEKEVAIDPELLGKTYEKFNAIRPDNFDEYLKALKSGNKGEETKFNKQYGVYYTPREIVHYMCRESLINYLATEFESQTSSPEKLSEPQLDFPDSDIINGQLPLEIENKSNPHISKKNIETLINFGELFEENEAAVEAKGKETNTYYYKLHESIRENAELIDAKLAGILICDPAVGSGAFPVGMMHEIVSTRNILSIFIKDEKRNKYSYKRQCIEKSLYGVDIDPGAVEIAKLRLWLSLVVDEEDIANIKPLPNLDYKIVCGNSLIDVKKDLLNAHLFDELENVKPFFFNETNPTKKQKYKKQIDDLILKLSNGHKDFDFEVYFSEVFHKKGGFDIVIGNPPYFSLDTVEPSFKKILRKLYPVIYTSQSNIYFFFIKKSLQILSVSGALFFINENYYLSSKNAHLLRKFLQENSSILHLINFRNVQLFENVNTLTVINSFKKRFVVDNMITSLMVEDSANKLDENGILRFLISPTLQFQQKKLDSQQWLLSSDLKSKLKEKIQTNSIPLRSCVDMGQGMTSGNNDVFIVSSDKAFELGIEKELLKKYVKTRDIKPYSILFRDQYLIYTLKDTDLNKYSNVKKYLTNNKKILLQRFEVKRDPSRWFSISVQRNRNFFEYYDEKLLTPLYSKGNKFAFDDCKTNNFFVLTDVYILVPKAQEYPLKYLLALLNSKLFNYYVLSFGKLKRDGYYEYSKNTLSNLPIKRDDSFSVILSISNNIIQTKIADPDANTHLVEDQIDIMVYKLYNLTYEEVKIIDPNIEQLISKEEYERFSL